MQTETKIKIPIQPQWHALRTEAVISALRADPERGLADEETAKRLAIYGKNELPRGKTATWWEILLRQFTSPLVYILVVAAILTGWIKEYADMGIILAVVAVNALIGLYQEYRANKIFETLRAIVKIQAVAVRGGKNHVLDAEGLVPGDVVILRGGDKVPADARLLSVSGLAANEALLTGESKSVQKNLQVAPEKSLVGDRRNMVFMGTLIEQGGAHALVVGTGARTEIGRITVLTQSAEEEQSPLQIRMGKLGKFLTEVFLVLSGAIFIIGIARGDGFIEMAKTTIAVAVAAIPEGLPAAISIILAVSSQKILARKGLVRKLIAAETLGSTSVICTDKTGTLTYGEMRVEEIIARDQDNALLSLALANEAILEEKDGKPLIRGEATDRAKLQRFLQNGNLAETLARLPRLAMMPFDDRRKFIGPFHRDNKHLRIFISGAPEFVLKHCSITKKQGEEVRKTYESLASRGYRVIAAAHKKQALPKIADWSSEKTEKYVEKLDYVGLIALRDPIREDVKETMKTTRQAGIKIIMVTGDHILTARSIGLELGFQVSGGSIVTGEELDQMSERELEDRIGTLEVIARVNPEHKMRIIDAWKKRGAVVAMTGDGVNDAPALKAADIGVAIGSGTDVAKEASELVLLDDSFSTITAAVREGRAGFANIRKATTVVMSNAFTEIIPITAALAFAIPFPITAVQILWVNLVEDSLPVLALAFEPAERKIMNSLPTSPKEPILNQEIKTIIFGVGIFTDLVLFGIYYYLYKNSGWEFREIQTFVFMATAAPTLVNIFALKSLKESIFRTNLLNNRFLVFAVLLGFALMFAAVYVPFLNNFLKTMPLHWTAALGSILVFPLLKLIMIELTKWWYREREARA